jgi:hypothetical protein
MTGQAAEPTEPTSAKDLHDEIVAMFDEALARKFEPDSTASAGAADTATAAEPRHA